MEQQQTDIKQCKVITSPNIAIIKYWGKLSEELIIPLNQSLGFTLSAEDISTTTTIKYYSKINTEINEENILKINNRPHPLNSRLKKLFKAFADDHRRLEIDSINNFPTKSGMASSASGMSALALGLNNILDNKFDEKQIQIATRQASGSACRSVLGGLVLWQGSDLQVIFQPQLFKTAQNFFSGKQIENLEQLSLNCISTQVFPAQKFKNQISFLILCDEFKEKKTGSTDGMKLSVQTSTLLQQRIKEIEQRTQSTIQAIENENWNTMIINTIKDSNQFHAVCMDSTPPIFYLNNFSHQIISIVEFLNTKFDCKIGYTFDAGPHAVLILQEKNKNLILRIIDQLLQIEKNTIQINLKAKISFEQAKNQYSQLDNQTEQILYELQEIYQNIPPLFIFHTEVGDGPIIV